MLLSPITTVSLEVLSSLIYSMEHQLSGVLWEFLPNFFFRPIFVKKAEIFEFFSNTFHIPHCPLRFVIVTIIFIKCICKIHSLLG